MAFLFTFWKPIAAGIAIVAVLIALGVVKHRYDEGKREEGRAALRPQLEASIAAEKEREAENAKCVAASKEQSDAIVEANTRAKAAQDATAKLIAAARAISLQNAGLVTKLQAHAAAVPRAQSCEQTLKAADAIVDESIRARRK